jgi:DNA-binding NarL/FixJ family response regulator
MQSPGVVILQSDWRVAQSMVDSFSDSFESVQSVNSLDEVRSSLIDHNWAVLIMDLEAVALRDVQDFSQQFPDVKIICNHRLADDEMWAAALDAGAVDFCRSSDTTSILRAAAISTLTRTPTH